MALTYFCLRLLCVITEDEVPPNNPLSRPIIHAFATTKPIRATTIALPFHFSPIPLSPFIKTLKRGKGLTCPPNLAEGFLCLAQEHFDASLLATQPLGD
ncbi:MAG: hypothetical protein LKKZDAJK_001001, partial [Candidatus Fervidibacter sp.]